MGRSSTSIKLKMVKKKIVLSGEAKCEWLGSLPAEVDGG